MILGPSAQPPFGHQQVLAVPLPLGAVVPYAGPVDDEKTRRKLQMSGWLLCNGRKVPQVRYPLLYQLLGDAYGDAPADYFRLPDYRGAFLRGVNGKRRPKLDPDAKHRTGSGPGGSGNSGNAVGSFQEQQFQEHEHKIESTPFSIPTGKDGTKDVVVSVTSPTTEVVCKEGTTGSTECFGKETRPVNLYVNFLIKALPDRVTLTVPATAGLELAGRLR